MYDKNIKSQIVNLRIMSNVCSYQIVPLLALSASMYVGLPICEMSAFFQLLLNGVRYHAKIWYTKRFAF